MSPLEKAARAAYDGHDFKPRDDMGGDLRFDELATFYQDYWRNSARAVLLAVQDLDEKTIRDVMGAFPGEVDGFEFAFSRAIASILEGE